MIYKQNLHTHTTFCDGKDTPEELVLEAINRGFSSIGFSEHSYMHFSNFSNQLTIEQMPNYINEINQLKTKYQDVIDIFCGLEYELFSEVPVDNLDYMIGSVHYLKFGDEILGFDTNLEKTLNYVKENFGGDGITFAKKYFETLITLPEKHKFDIIGHFDLLMKNNENGRFIDPSAKEYLNLGYEAIHTLKGKIPLFEVNTGAMYRKGNPKPYPAEFMMKHIKDRGGLITITSDSHCCESLDFAFDEMIDYCKNCGFTEAYYLTSQGRKKYSL